MAAIALTIHLLLTRTGVKPLVSALAVGGTLMVLASWQGLRGIGPLLLLMMFVLVPLAQRRIPTTMLDWLGLWFVAAFGLIPMLQLGIAHIRDSTPIPVTNTEATGTIEPSGSVEDVVLVVVDAYPNLRVAEKWFDHQPHDLVGALESQGFVVEANAWSRHTFTSLSVASILELASVVDDGPVEPWGNRSTLWRILRGDNVTSEALKTAGFAYTHIESNWDGSSCGPAVDRCIQSPWVDERVWRLLGSTIAEPWARHYNYAGTLHTTRALATELAAIQDNGVHDFLFAHFLMPHEPVLVDGDCTPLSQPVDLTGDVSARRAAIANQMGCVDRLVSEALSNVDDDTAMLVTGDHGSGTGGQVGSPSGEWSDTDIAERFSVFLSYKLPSNCEAPMIPDPVAAMSAVMTCSTSKVFVASEPRYLIGDEDPQYVDPARMARIKAAVAAGTLTPDAG